MTGLESLRIKETDRIAAFQKELSKINTQVIEKNGSWKLIPDEDFAFTSPLEFDTYEDHRMAMALAPIATQTDIIIAEPEVVHKSYPRYWEDYSRVEFKLESL